MTRKLLLTATAVLSLAALPSGANADGCLFGDRTGARASTAVHTTDRVLRRTGDAIVRTGDRMFGWMTGRTRT